MTDIRLLNVAMINSAYPLTNIQKKLAEVERCKIFMTIDACGTYHWVQIEEGSTDLQLSSVLSGPYVHVFFGLSKAGSVYSWVLDLALAYLPADYWLSYLDGILVYSMDF